MYKREFHAGLERKVSMDKIVNVRGRRFLDFCDDNGLLILNGFTRGDEEGRFTFTNAVGDSVNDLCVVSHELLKWVRQLQIEEQIWSDHQPLVLKINAGRCVNAPRRMNLLPKLIWRDSQKEAYNNRLTEGIASLKEQNIEITLGHLQTVIRQSAPQINLRPSFRPKNKWFDKKCEDARCLSMRLLNNFRQTNEHTDKLKYLNSNWKYKEVCKKAKRSYYANIERKIGMVNDSKQWWSLVNELRGSNGYIKGHISAQCFVNHFKDLLSVNTFLDDIQYAPAFTTDQTLDTEITLAEVKDVLSKVKLNKAPGEDRIPYEFLANANDDFLLELTKVYNTFLQDGRVDEAFTKSVIFPIFKKGDADLPSNYRGISFMNCIAKVFMGILNARLYRWCEQHNILKEYQAGFRKQYSTADNIFNLAAIARLKLNQKKKLFAFFVDFKAAFDKIPRKLLMYKLRSIGVSHKFVNAIEAIYSCTKSAVWTGEELSDYFESELGLKQGCLLSPLLFSLFLNDMDEEICGGIRLYELNIPLLMYADDIVLLAESATDLQSMINNLEHYCAKWGLQVNTLKSEVMVFRNGGRLADNEKWFYEGRQLNVVNEYTYLGVVITPKMMFQKHTERKNLAAKNSINSTWKVYLANKQITLSAKWRLFLAVCRSIQSYAAQVWGYGYFEEVDKLERFFLKKLLRLPNCTPNYALLLETNLIEGHFYTLSLHLKYLGKILFDYGENRLPHVLAHKIIQENIFWAREINNLASEADVNWSFENTTPFSWQLQCKALIESMQKKNFDERLNRARQSETRIYKNLRIVDIEAYFSDTINIYSSSLVFKARCDLLPLNGRRLQTNAVRTCSLCNRNEIEDTRHFIGICPALRDFRWRAYGKSLMNEQEIIAVLNGDNDPGWKKLIDFATSALKFRAELIAEFNY